MKVNLYKLSGSNTGKLDITDEKIDIKPRRWVRGETSHPMNFTAPVGFENNNVYALHLFGDVTKKAVHISLSFWDNQKFLFMQKSHWIQKEENLRYIVNILFLIGGFTMAILEYLK